jgi:hypothetical protein
MGKYKKTPVPGNQMFTGFMAEDKKTNKGTNKKRGRKKRDGIIGS